MRCHPRVSVLTQASPGERQSLPINGMADYYCIGQLLLVTNCFEQAITDFLFVECVCKFNSVIERVTKS